MTDWFTQLKKAKKTCLVDRNFKKIHYDFGCEREMVEEYNLDTNVLTRRAWKYKKDLEGGDKWDIEIGDPDPTYNRDEDTLIRENSNQPFVSRRITKTNLEWRIRNLPYPLEIYSVTVDPEGNCLIVRTSNKKYYKKLSVPDLDRLNLRLQSENISFSHKFNTLVIVYKKPKALIEFEMKLLQEIKGLEPNNQQNMECTPS